MAWDMMKSAFLNKQTKNKPAELKQGVPEKCNCRFF
jgi:hypothetical protein